MREPLATFAGWSEETWPFGLNDNQVRDGVVKSICGKSSAVEGGDYQLTIAGGAFVLLGAVAPVGKTPELLERVSADAPDKWLDKPLLTTQTQQLARRTNTALYKLFKRIVLDEREEELIVEKVHIDANGFCIVTGINSLENRIRPNRPALAAGIGQGLAKIVGCLPTFAEPIGRTSQAVAEYFISANTRDKGIL